MTTYNFVHGIADGNVQLAPLADLPPLYTKMAALRPAYWRIMLPWNLTAKTKEPGTAVAGTPPTTTGRDWSYIDRCINDILLKVGCEILMIVGQGRPSWGGWFFGFGATAGTATDYGNFCGEAATRYKPGGVGIRTDGIYAPNAGKGVTHWEIWNEQNSQLWGSNVDPVGYTAHLKAAYTAIKAVQPGAASTVIYGGLQHVIREPAGYFGYGSNNLDEITFLTRCYDAGAHGYFDAMAEHIYTETDTEDPPVAVAGTTRGPVPNTTTDNWQQLLLIRNLMVAKGDGAKPIWITECAFSTQLQTPANQLAYTQQLFTQLSALPYVPVVITYNGRDSAPTNDSNGHIVYNDSTNADVNNTYGLMYYDLVEKPIYQWLLSLASAPAAGTVTIPVTVGGAGVGGSSGTVTLPVTVHGTGAERYTRAGTVTVPLSVSGVGAERYIRAGTVTVPLSVSGYGGIPGVVSGAITLPVTVSGTGTEHYAGSGTVTVTLSASGTGAAVVGHAVPSHVINQAVNRAATQ